MGGGEGVGNWIAYMMKKDRLFSFKKIQGRKNGSVVKQTYYSYRGPDIVITSIVLFLFKNYYFLFICIFLHLMEAHNRQ